ncbi:hypothetical protein AB0E83_12450 [Streptomyces sp. NPDC035033]
MSRPLNRGDADTSTELALTAGALWAGAGLLVLVIRSALLEEIGIIVNGG